MEYSMLSKQQTSKILLRQSRFILKSCSQAMLPPLLSNIIVLVLLSFVIHPFINHEANLHFIQTASAFNIILLYLLLLLFLFITHIFVFFFMATLATQILQRFKHKPTHFIAAICLVSKRLLSLYAWFLYASFFGFSFVILQHALQRLNWFKTLTQKLNWKHATYFVVPILLTTRIKTTDAIRKSSQLMASSWGSPLQNNHGFNQRALPAKIAAFIPLIAGIIQGSHLFIIIGSATSIFLLVVIASYFMSIRMIICCGCYLHASKENVSESFDTDAIKSAFVPLEDD
jgi:hypothetical protein